MITIEVVDEDGELVPDVQRLIDSGLLSRITREPAYEGSCCLGYIDPYGYTVFNRLQMDAFLQELQWLDARAVNDEDMALVDALRGFAEMVRDEVHLYLKFIGD